MSSHTVTQGVSVVGAGGSTGSPIISTLPKSSSHELPVVFWTRLLDGVEHLNSSGPGLGSPAPLPSSDLFLFSHTYLRISDQQLHLTPTWNCSPDELIIFKCSQMSWLYSYSSFLYFLAVLWPKAPSERTIYLYPNATLRKNKAETEAKLEHKPGEGAIH